MTFNELIRKDIAPFFKEHAFTVTEPLTTCVQFESQFIVVSLVYNKYEYMYGLWIGRVGKNLCEVDSKNLKQLFGREMNDFKSMDSFASGVLSLFQNRANSLLKGDLRLLDLLDDYMKDRNREYNEQVQKRAPKI